ncbi:MAG: F0F1 ATP synthase subunit C [Kofleriaceae bacterium]|nr:F0F1 ATP synthase subunit C [Kofleriaceae bacterium]MCL4225758.1 F0F1 ATP synthase subunit C [Myxococcales bacterium]
MANRMIKRITSFLSFCLVMGISGVAFAQSAGEQAVASQGGIMVFGASLGLGLAALGGGLAQGRAAAAALDGIARNPGAADKVRGPMILGLALIESLVIYALIIALLVVTKF